MKILFWPRHAVAFRKMLPQCRLIRDRLPYRPVVVIPPGGEAWIAECAAEGIAWLDCSSGVPADPFVSTAESWQALSERVPAPLRRILADERVACSLPADIWRFQRAVRQLRTSYRYWRKVLEREAPLAVMMPGDRELGFVPAVLRAAADLRIPAVVGLTASPTSDGLIANRRGQRRYRSREGAPVMNRLAAALWPRQVAGSDDGPLLFSPGWLTLALGTHRMLSANPWFQGGGNSTDMIVDGERKHEAYMAAGVPAAKLRMIGDLSHAALFRHLQDRGGIRARLEAKYGLEPAKKLVVFAVPIFAEHGLLGWAEHRRQLDLFAAQLAVNRQNVLLSFHPKSRREEYSFLTGKHQLVAASEPLEELLPAADLFIGGNSSTLDWAVLCRKPVINIDYAGIRDRAYLGNPALFNAPTPESFQAALARILPHPEQVGALQDELARKLSLFDGKVEERFLDFIRDVCMRAGRTPAAPASAAERRPE
jgi:hypothetical protein